MFSRINKSPGEPRRRDEMILKIRVETDNYETVNTLLAILKEKYEKVYLAVGTKKNTSVRHLVFNCDGRINNKSITKL